MVLLFKEEQLDDVFIRIASTIDFPVEGFLIGGLAMIKNKMKIATKDIDIIFSDEKMAREFIRAAREVGFNPDTELPPEYEEMDTMIVLKDKNDRRIDVFVRIVIKGLIYTEFMKDRTVLFNLGDRLTVRVSSNEDIFLFKAISPRPRDLEDMEILARTGDIDWDIIESEARIQPSSWKWIGRLFGRLLELEAKTGIVTPLTNRLMNEAEIAQAIEILIDKIEDAPIEKKEANEILYGEDEEFVENVISSMMKFGLIKVEDGKIRLR